MKDRSMNIPKIPITTLAGVASLSDLLHELPLPGPHPDSLDYSLLCHVPPLDLKTKHEFAVGDIGLASRVADILGSVNTDHISLKSDNAASCYTDAGVDMLPMLEAVLNLKPDVFKPNKKPPQPQTQQPVENPPNHLPPQEIQKNEFIPTVSANEITSSKTEPDHGGEQFSVDNMTQGNDEHKICIKIRKKKRSTRDSDHANPTPSDKVRYGIVGGNESPATTGTLKLKLSRVKTDESGKFQVSKEPTAPVHTPPAPVQQQPYPSPKEKSHGHKPHKSSKHNKHEGKHHKVSKSSSWQPSVQLSGQPVVKLSRQPNWQEAGLIDMPSQLSGQFNTDVTSAEFIKQTSQRPLQPTDFQKPSPPKPMRKKKMDHVRVKFLADMEEADIHRLSDLMYPDDTEVESFNDLNPGDIVVAKWPLNGKLYEAEVIDPMSSADRKFRERKAPPQPYQAGPQTDRHGAKMMPRVVLNKVDAANLSSFNPAEDSFHSMYMGMADRIKMKKRSRAEMEESKNAKRMKLMQMDVDYVSDDEDFSSKGKTDSRKKMERRRMAQLKMVEEGALKRMSSLVDTIFEDIDTDGQAALALAGDESVPECLLISLPRLNTLASETLKLKSTGMLNQVPTKTIVRLLNLLSLNIRAASGLKPLAVDRNLTPEQQRWNKDACFDRIFAASNACVIAMHVMTTPCMPKAVFIEDVMDQTAQLLRFQLENTIYPEYDQVYKSTSSKKGKESNLSSSKQKRAHYKGTKNTTILQLYNRLVNLVSLWAQLLEVQQLTDNTVLKVSTIAISPFFVENVRELQLSALQLTTALFARYEKHRKIIVEDIFQSLARLPTSKRNLRNFRLNYVVDDEVVEGQTTKPYIQMVSALMLQMIHAITKIQLQEEDDDEEDEDNQIKKEAAVNEMLLVSSYENSTRIAQAFLSAFLRKCSSKGEEIDFRPIFEHFVHDLLATVNKPEWPAAEMMLSFLGQLLVHTFNNRSNEMALRVAAIDYLGAIAAKLRRDVVSSHLDVSLVHAIIRQADNPSEADAYDENNNKNSSKKDPDICKLYRILLYYIQRNMDSDSALVFAHNFYIGQWMRDISHQMLQLKKKRGNEDDEEEDSKVVRRFGKHKTAVLRLATEFAVEQATKRERSLNDSTNFNSMERMQYGSALTYEQATLITRYLASGRPFTHSFDVYLTHILRLAKESAVAIRTRAIKCLAEIVAVDPNILSREDIWCGVEITMMDPSTSVREASIDLIGRFILLKPDLVPKYYTMLTARIMDTGVSVRKRVIKILRDLCYEYPNISEFTDACVKIISRINDEDGIKKLVHEVFMRLWFSPVDQSDHHNAGQHSDSHRTHLDKKVASICDVVAANNELGYTRIEQMMKNLIDADDPRESVELACKQVVNCLVQNIIKIEQLSKNEEIKKEIQEDENSESEDENEEKPKQNKLKSSVIESGPFHERISAVMRTLVLFTKIRPQLMVENVGTLQPYIATKCKDGAEMMTEKCVCKILELSIPLMVHPGDAFLASLEEDLMKIILRDPLPVVQSAIACLGAVTKLVTKNYKLVRDCCQKIFRILSNIRTAHQAQGDKVLVSGLPVVKRTLFITGQLMRTFDFDEKQMKGDIQASIKKQVFSCMYYFTQLKGLRNVELRSFAVSALGLLMIQDPSMMFEEETKTCYMDMLSPQQPHAILTKQVLLNLRSYLHEEEELSKGPSTSEEAKADGTEDPKFEDIKEINDVSSGMASSVTLLYLKQILAAFFHPQSMVRSAAIETVRLILEHGLVNPSQCIPHVIAMSADTAQVLASIADQQLSEVNKNYSWCVRRSALQGIRMSYRLNTCIHKKHELIRGCRHTKTNEESTATAKASCSHLYSLIRNDKKNRRTLMLNLLHLFDDTVKSDLALLLFIADNLATFPYQTSDEPLFLMCQIEVYASVSGGNVLQTFRDSLKKKHAPKAAEEEGKKDVSDDDLSDLEESDADEIESRLPENDNLLIDFMETSLACSLLLHVKQHLKTVYGFTDAKIQRYSPNESGRGYEKQCSRKRANAVFAPVQVTKYLLMKITNNLPSKPSTDETFKEIVVQQYLSFNELMRKIDPNDSNSDSDKETTKAGRKSTEPKKANTAAPESNVISDHHEESDRDSDVDETKKPSALEVASRSGQAKLKKKMKEKFRGITAGDYAPVKDLRNRGKVNYGEDSDSDSEEEFLGF